MKAIYIDLANGPSHKPLIWRLYRCARMFFNLLGSEIGYCPGRFEPIMSWQLAYGLWLAHGCPCWKCHPLESMKEAAK
jgi:hypothetical protein